MDFPTPLGIGLAAALAEGSPSAVNPAWQVLGRGVWLGLGAAMPIGPVNVEIARRVLRNGFLTGVALGCGAVTVDVAYAVLSTVSFVRVLAQPTFVLPVTALGVLLLAYLGVQCLRAAIAALRRDPLEAALDGTADVRDDGAGSPVAVDGTDDASGDDPAAGTTRGPAAAAYFTGLLMTLLNPMTLAFWFTVVPATGAGIADVPPSAAAPGGPSAASAAARDLAVLCAGVFVGTVAWVLVFAGLLARANRVAGRGETGDAAARRRRRWLAGADGVGGIALLFFAGLAAAEFWRRLSLLI